MANNGNYGDKMARLPGHVSLSGLPGDDQPGDYKRFLKDWDTYEGSSPFPEEYLASRIGDDFDPEVYREQIGMSADDIMGLPDDILRETIPETGKYKALGKGAWARANRWLQFGALGAGIMLTVGATNLASKAHAEDMGMVTIGWDNPSWQVFPQYGLVGIRAASWPEGNPDEMEFHDTYSPIAIGAPKGHMNLYLPIDSAYPYHFVVSYIYIRDGQILHDEWSNEVVGVPKIMGNHGLLGDLVVDLEDYYFWIRPCLGCKEGDPNWSDGEMCMRRDFNGDGVINTLDSLKWRDNYGKEQDNPMTPDFVDNDPGYREFPDVLYPSELYPE
jgi:hypothetical protein